MRICSTDGCDEKHNSLGYCKKHYREFRASQICTETGCDVHVHAGKRCHRHYDELRALNAPPCKLDDCSVPSSSLGYCRKHYARFRRTGSAGPAGNLIETNVGKICAGPDCSRAATRKGYCGAHYCIVVRRGEEARPLKMEYVPTRGMSLGERLEYYSSPPDERGCRLWTGGLTVRGYAVVNDGGNTRLAHRRVYEIHNGTQLQSHEPVHHICSVNRCVAIEHLQKVESWENSAEMLERQWFEERIAELEAALGVIAPDHELPNP